MTETARPQRVEYEGLGDTLEGALKAAHDQIPVGQGFDFTTSRVVDWGMQKGGFVVSTKYYVRVVAEMADFMT